MELEVCGYPLQAEWHQVQRQVWLKVMEWDISPTADLRCF